MYNPTTGASKCLLCPSGRYLEDRAQFETAHDELNDCKQCIQGRYHNESGKTTICECKNCKPGLYLDTVGGNECKTCTPGFAQPNVASISCNKCKNGYESSSKALTCTEIPVITGQLLGLPELPQPVDGTVLTYRIALSLPPAVNNKVVVTIMSDNSKYCKLATDTTEFTFDSDNYNDGYFINVDLRLIWPPLAKDANNAPNIVVSCVLNHSISTLYEGYYTNFTTKKILVNVRSRGCGDNEYRAISYINNNTNRICQCLQDNYLNISDVGSPCKRCPNGALCNRVGFTLQTLINKKGYWRVDTKTAIFHKCLYETDCIDGGSVSNRTQCQIYHEGPLCSVCKDGYTRQGDSRK
jgi:hypothetical protein